MPIRRNSFPLLLGLSSTVLGSAPAQDISRTRIRVVTPPPPPADTPLVHDVPPNSALVQELTRKSSLARPDTLLVHSGFGDYGAFTGSPIDTASYALFEPFYRELAFGHEDSELFATLQVPLGSGRVAYLLRVPGMYEPSAIDLWVYDAHRGRFELPIQLAEVWGDAGESFEVQSWLVTPKGDGTLDVVLRKVTDYKRIVVDTLTDSATLIPVSHSDSLWFVTCGPSGTIKRLLPANSPLAGIFDPEKWSRGPR